MFGVRQFIVNFMSLVKCVSYNLTDSLYSHIYYITSEIIIRNHTIQYVFYYNTTKINFNCVTNLQKDVIKNIIHVIKNITTVVL